MFHQFAEFFVLIINYIIRISDVLVNSQNEQIQVLEGLKPPHSLQYWVINKCKTCKIPLFLTQLSWVSSQFFLLVYQNNCKKIHLPLIDN